VSVLLSIVVVISSANTVIDLPHLVSLFFSLCGELLRKLWMEFLCSACVSVHASVVFVNNITIDLIISPLVCHSRIFKIKHQLFAARYPLLLL